MGSPGFRRRFHDPLARERAATAHRGLASVSGAPLPFIWLPTLTLHAIAGGLCVGNRRVALNVMAPRVPFCRGFALYRPPRPRLWESRCRGSNDGQGPTLG